MACGWVGEGGAYALRLYSHDVAVGMKPLFIPQNSSVLWVAENYCRARALSIFHSNRTMSYQHVPVAIWLCTNGGNYTPQCGTQYPPIPNTLPPFTSYFLPCLHRPWAPTTRFLLAQFLPFNPRKYEKLSLPSRSSQLGFLSVYHMKINKPLSFYETVTTCL